MSLGAAMFIFLLPTVLYWYFKKNLHVDQFNVDHLQVWTVKVMKTVQLGLFVAPFYPGKCIFFFKLNDIVTFIWMHVLSIDKEQFLREHHLYHNLHTNVCVMNNSDLKQTTAATRTPPNKTFNEQNSGCARAL